MAQSLLKQQLLDLRDALIGALERDYAQYKVTDMGYSFAEEAAEFVYETKDGRRFEVQLRLLET